MQQPTFQRNRYHTLLLHQADFTMHRVICVFCYSLLASYCAGCGNQGDEGKSFQHAQRQRAIPSDKPLERRIDSGSAAPVATLAKQERLVAEPIAAAPATLQEVLKVVNLQEMPKPPNATVKIARTTQLIYSVPGTLADAAAFCKEKLTELGWTEDHAQVPGLDPNRYVVAGFDKAGFHLTLSISKSMKEGLIDVNLTHYGNVDPRRLPRPADAKATFDYWHYVSYATAATPQEVIELCRNELAAKGWKQYPVANAKFHAQEGKFLVGFVNNAVDLSLNAKAEAEGRTVVEYRVQIRDTPRRQTAAMPPAATLTEGMTAIDLNRFPRLAGAEEGRGSSADMYYEAPGDVAGALGFYREKLKADRWTDEPPHSVDEIEDMVITSFDKGGFHLKLQISKGDKSHRVRIHLEHRGNIDVRQFPRLGDASEGGLEDFDDVRYETETKPGTTVEFYRKELLQRGWKEFQSETKDYPDESKSLVFGQNAILVKLRVDKDSVRIQSELVGERIPRPAPEAETLRAIDLRKVPRLKGATGAQVDSARVEYTVAGTIANVLRFYQGEFSKRGWAERSTTTPRSANQACVRFAKGPFVVGLSVQSEDGKPITVLVQHRGDLDLRKLLHPLDAKIDPASEQEEMKLATNLSLKAAKDYYRQELPKFGWKEGSGSSNQTLEFSQNAARVMVTFRTSPEAITTVQLRSWIVGKK
jgi:hypothetical protein